MVQFCRARISVRSILPSLVPLDGLDDDARALVRLRDGDHAGKAGGRLVRQARVDRERVHRRQLHVGPEE